MYDIFYIGKIEQNNIPKHHRHIGGIMERVFGITLILNEKIEIFKFIHSIIPHWYHSMLSWCIVESSCYTI